MAPDGEQGDKGINVIFTLLQLEDLHSNSRATDKISLDALKALHTVMTGGQEFINEHNLAALKSFVQSVEWGTPVEEAIPAALKPFADKVHFLELNKPVLAAPESIPPPKPQLQSRAEMLTDAAAAQGPSPSKFPEQPRRTLDDCMQPSAPNMGVGFGVVPFEKAVDVVAKLYMGPKEIQVPTRGNRARVWNDLGKLLHVDWLKYRQTGTTKGIAWDYLAPEKASELLQTKANAAQGNDVDLDAAIRIIGCDAELVRTDLDAHSTLGAIYGAVSMRSGAQKAIIEKNYHDLVGSFPNDEIIPELVSYAKKLVNSPAGAMKGKKLDTMLAKGRKQKAKAERAVEKQAKKEAKKKKPVSAPGASGGAKRAHEVSGEFAQKDAQVQAASAPQPAPQAGVAPQPGAPLPVPPTPAAASLHDQAAASDGANFGFEQSEPAPKPQPAPAAQAGPAAPQPEPAQSPAAQQPQEVDRKTPVMMPKAVEDALEGAFQGEFEPAEAQPEPRKGLAARVGSLFSKLKIWGRKKRPRRLVSEPRESPKEPPKAEPIPVYQAADGFADTVHALMAGLAEVNQEDPSKTTMFRAMHFDYGVAPVMAPVVENGDITRLLFDIARTNTAIIQAASNKVEHTKSESDYSPRPLEEAISGWANQFKISDTDKDTLRQIAVMYVEKAAALYDTMDDSSNRPKLVSINPNDGRKYAANIVGDRLHEIFRTLIAERAKGDSPAHSYTQSVELKKILAECYEVVLEDNSGENPSPDEEQARISLNAMIFSQVLPEFGLYKQGGANIMVPEGTAEDELIEAIVLRTLEAYKGIEPSVPRQRVVEPAAPQSEGTRATVQLPVVHPGEEDLIPIEHAASHVRGYATYSGEIIQDDVEAELRKHKGGVVRNSAGVECFRKGTLDSIARRNSHWVDKDRERLRIQGQMDAVAKQAEDAKSMLEHYVGNQDDPKALKDIESMIGIAKSPAGPYGTTDASKPNNYGLTAADPYDVQIAEANARFQAAVNDDDVPILVFLNALNVRLAEEASITNKKYLDFFRQIDENQKNLKAAEARYHAAESEIDTILQREEQHLNELESVRSQYKAEAAAHRRFRRRVYGSVAAAAVLVLAVGSAIVGPRVYNHFKTAAAERAVIKESVTRMDKSANRFSSRMDNLIERIKAPIDYDDAPALEEGPMPGD